MTHPFLLSLCLLLLPQGEAAAPQGKASGEAPKPPKAPDLQPETALQRVKQRNLFHPTRGVLPAGVGLQGAVQAKWPALVGTTMAGKVRLALLRWGTDTALSLGKGEIHEDVEVLAIEGDRVQLKHQGTGDVQWVDLDRGQGPETPGSASEYQGLLSSAKGQGPDKAPRPPAAPVGNAK